MSATAADTSIRAYQEGFRAGERAGRQAERQWLAGCCDACRQRHISLEEMKLPDQDDCCIECGEQLIGPT